jgi:hypothetical protein
LNLTIISIHLNHYEGFKSTLNSVSEFYSIGVSFKWLIKDGGSDSDILIKIKQDLEVLNKDIFTFVSRTDNGVYDAMNDAMGMVANNRMVLFLNCGDQLSPEFINQINQESLHDFDFVYSDTQLNGSEEKFISPKDIDFAYLAGKTINHQSYLIKSELLKQYPFNTHFSIVADWVQLMEIFRKEQLVIKKLNFPISIYEGGGISEKQDDLRILQRAEYLKSIYSEWELNSIIKLSRMRQRPWYDFIISALDSPKRSWVLKQILRF